MRTPLIKYQGVRIGLLALAWMILSSVATFVFPFARSIIS
jgi:hypothetical protein